MKPIKLFTAISLSLLALAQQATACIWFDTHNHYLFSVYDSHEFKYRVDSITTANWKAYLGSDEMYFNFQADEVRNFAQKKGDALMVSYVDNLSRYLDCAEQVRYESWNYPTKEELAQRKKTLEEVRLYAQGKLKSRLRSQHALLLMRCNMMLGRHAENIQIWEQTTSNYIETVYKDMMKNIYAGALYKQGQGVKAAQIFAEQGDWESLMAQFYLKRSYQAIRQEYQRDPNSPVLPFLLQDFVNNAQEAVDDTGVEGKLFIRTIQRTEAQQMWQFAGQVAREGKTATPSMWKSAQAWLEFLFGNRQQAMTDIQLAATLQGTDRMKDNARVLQLYILSAQMTPGKKFDQFLAKELEWLDGKSNGDSFFGGAYDRLIHQVLLDKYTKANRQSEALSLLNATYDWTFNEYCDTMKVESLIKFLDFVNSPAQTPLEQYLKPRQQPTINALNDLIGTKYMRLCQWKEAEKWLQKVPLAYYNDKGYVVYAAFRHTNIEPWITRQWLPEYDDEEEAAHQPSLLTSNPKMDFIREMQELETGMGALTGKARQQRCYDLAVRYAQASYTGDCWYLMRDSKSVYDTVRVHEADLVAKARELLREVSRGSDRQLKERALFALSYVYLNPDRWFKEEWNSELNEYVRKSVPQSQQYKAFATLYNFELTPVEDPSDYVTRCDEYVQFKKAYLRR